MLHEVLLALSGHPSPLFNIPDQSHHQPSSTEFPLLSPSERALLQTIGKLSELHRKLRQHAKLIASTHRSIICRAVAISLQQKHLARFQKKILDVESQILTKDATLVGAYDIVPLAGLVSEFDDWHRRMAWYWEMACFMESPNVDPTSSQPCSGAAVIDRLRAESSTGFPEIAGAAVELSQVAETTWLKQLASWVLYVKLPSHGGNDFFVQVDNSGQDDMSNFKKEKALLPAFVNAVTATSIVFIGRSLHQIRQRQQQSLRFKNDIDEAQLARMHMEHLTALSLPIQAAQLSRAISAIRMSLSQNALQHLLPIELTMRVLDCLRQYFLLSKGEFAVALIDQVDSRLQARQQNMGRLLQQDPIKAMKGLAINDAELQQILVQSWKALSREDEDEDADTLDFARKHIVLTSEKAEPTHLSVSDSASGATPRLSQITFDDLLMPSTTRLDMSIESPLDLFITSAEIKMYSVINSYLLSIRRAEIHLSDLWRRTIARREHPSPSSRTRRHEPSTEHKTRTAKRSREQRKVWATCSATLFLISETAAYFEGEIVKSSFDHFEQWVSKPSGNNGSPTDSSPKDPETLSSAHRAFLASLTYALLLTDTAYTRDLRSLLGNIDALIAFFNRLLDVQSKHDLELAADSESNLTVEDERTTALELDRARKKVDSDLRSVVNRLRMLDQERVGSARYWDVKSVIERGGYEPWKGGGVERLLMKLEFGRLREGEGYAII